MKATNSFKIFGMISMLILSLGSIVGCSSNGNVSNIIQ